MFHPMTSYPVTFIDGRSVPTSLCDHAASEVDVQYFLASTLSVSTDRIQHNTTSNTGGSATLSPTAAQFDGFPHPTISRTSPKSTGLPSSDDIERHQRVGRRRRGCFSRSSISTVDSSLPVDAVAGLETFQTTPPVRSVSIATDTDSGYEPSMPSSPSEVGTPPLPLPPVSLLVHSALVTSPLSAVSAGSNISEGHAETAADRDVISVSPAIAQSVCRYHFSTAGKTRDLPDVEKVEKGADDATRSISRRRQKDIVYTAEGRPLSMKECISISGSGWYDDDEENGDGNLDDEGIQLALQLLEHQKRHIHRCPFDRCPKVYTKRSHLKSHLRTHTGK